MNDRWNLRRRARPLRVCPTCCCAPPSGAPDAPLVVAWHLLDPPRTEAAFAAALPLDGLDAWRLYLGLPMSGSRTPEGGFDAVFEMMGQDAPGLVHGPIHAQAVAEAPAAIAEVRERAGIADGVPVGLMGGSMGGAIVAELLATRAVDARAAVLLNPLLELRHDDRRRSLRCSAATPGLRPAMPPRRSIDYVHRADEVAASGASVRVISGADDEPWFVASAGPSPTRWAPTCRRSPASGTRSPRSRASNPHPRRMPRAPTTPSRPTGSGGTCSDVVLSRRTSHNGLVMLPPG